MAVMAALSSSCSTRPTQETVTIDVGRFVDAKEQAVAIAPQLPERDPDLEAAGDHIAEAITRLHKRQNAAALTALSGAELSVNRALRTGKQPEQALNTLNASLKDIEAVRRAIQRGAWREALAELKALNKRMDSLAVTPDQAGMR